MTSQPLTTTVNFNSRNVPAVHHLNRLWLTAERVGECLGYAPGNERTGVIKLYNRHSDEFFESDSGVVKLATPSGVQESRIFSATGCVLLSFFASTPKAKQFRAWAKQVLAGEEVSVPHLVQLVETQQQLIDAQKKHLEEARRQGSVELMRLRKQVTDLSEENAVNAIWYERAEWAQEPMREDEARQVRLFRQQGKSWAYIARNHSVRSQASLTSQYRRYCRRHRGFDDLFLAGINL